MARSDSKRLARLLQMGLNREQARSARDWIRVIIFNARRRDLRQLVVAAHQMAEDLRDSMVLELECAADPDSQDIVRLCLPTKEHELLENAGITTVGELRARIGNLRSLFNVGVKTAALCQRRLNEYDAHCERVRDQTGVELLPQNAAANHREQVVINST